MPESSPDTPTDLAVADELEALAAAPALDAYLSEVAGAPASRHIRLERAQALFGPAVAELLDLIAIAEWVADQRGDGLACPVCRNGGPGGDHASDCVWVLARKAMGR